MMSDQQHAHTEEHAHGQHASLDKKKIWQVAGVLSLITLCEFILALWVLPQGYLSHHTGNFIYICLTLLKAFYIVAYFMHLKYEKLGLQLSLTVSFVLIFYFITLMLLEGGYLHLHMPFQ